MKLSQKVHSIWEGRNFFKRSRLLMSLTAMGILGGFFVLQASIAPFNITSPAEGEYVKGIKEVQWTVNTGVCTESDYVNVQYSTGGGFTTLATVKCLGGKASWDTTAMADNGNYQIRVFKDGDMGVNSLSKNFIIDNTLPVVDAATILFPNGGELVGGTTQTITWDATKISDLNLKSNPISLAYSINGGNDWTELATGLANSGTYSGALPSVNSEAVKVKITVTDKAGNFASDESNAVFKIDTTKPVANVVVDAVTVSDIQKEKTVTVNYDEVMDGNVEPLITFSAGMWNKISGSWADGDTWSGTFTPTSDGEEATVTVFAENAKDVAGNIHNKGTSVVTFLLDTKNPTVVSTITTPDPAKAGDLDVAVVFSEAMDTNMAPTVGVTGLTSLYSISGLWAADGKTWNGEFNLIDQNETKTATVIVTNAADLSGNVMAANLNAGSFGVDTVSPIGSVSFTSGTISDNNLTQTITVNYDEAMDISSKPSISFDNNSGSWGTMSESWSADHKSWVGNFKLVDANAETYSGVIATGAKDVAGNGQEIFVAPSSFNIDTKNPTVNLTDNHTDSVVKNGDSVSITATFDGTVQYAPTISIGSTVNNASMTSTDNVVWTYLWTVNSTTDGKVDVIISGIDVAGNPNTPATGKSSYTIDNQAPTVAINNMTTNDTTPIISGTMNDAAATVSVVVNGVNYATAKNAEGTGWAANISNVLADGTYDVIATISDIAGNVGHDITTNELIVDTVAPIITNFITPELNKVYGSDVSLVLTAADATALTYTYQIDTAGDKKPITFSVDRGEGITANAQNVPEGRHIIVLYINDAAGNEVSATSQSFVVDTNHNLSVGAVADFATIQSAINAATAGDTISVAAGSYAENIIIPADKNGLTISGSNQADTFINVAAGNAFTVNAPVTIQNFTIDLLGTGIYGVYEKGILGVTIQDNIIKHYKQNGVFAEGGNISVLRNTITGNGVQTDFSADSIYTKGGATVTVIGNTLSNNIFTNIPGGSSAGISIHAGDNVTIVGNTITGNSIGIHAKSGSIVDAYGSSEEIAVKGKNDISSNVYNFYFENDDAGLTSTFDLGNNWWGEKVKSSISGKIFGSIDFAPWYLDAAKTTLSSSDTTDPNVVITTDDTDSIVKAGQPVIITAAVTDANGIDGIPTITLSSGDVTNMPMTFVSGNDWKYSWTAPSGDSNVTATVVAYDAVGNDGLGTKTLVIDNSAPTFTVDDGVAAGPVKTDTIKISLTEAHGIAEAKYGFSSDNVCDVSDNYSTAFISGTAFDIAGDHTDYLCVMAKDAAGNIGYGLVGKLNTDNTAPAVPVVTLTDPVMSGNQASVEIKGTGEANSTFTWEIADKDGKKVSGIGAIGLDGVILIAAIDVTELVDGELMASVKLKDIAGTEGLPGTDEATKDVAAPTITKVTSDVENGTYTVNDVIGIDLTFSEKVKGTFNIVLNASATAGCSFTLTSLANSGTCDYQVLAGDNASKLATTISGVNVIDEAGNAMMVFTPVFDKDIIIDTNAPVIAPHPNVIVEATSADGAIVDYNFPTASDNFDSSVEITCTPSSHTLFKLGTTSVNCIATDNAGNVSASSFDVIVEDKTVPTIDDNLDMTVEATSVAGAVVTYSNPSATDLVDTVVTVSCTLVSGSTFAIGTTEVTCTATDDANNIATSKFNVTVRDTTGPVFGAYADLPPAEATSAAGAVVNYTIPTAIDAVDSSVTVSCAPVSGSTFALGTTKVTCTATDSRINSSTAEFNVTVQDTTVPSFADVFNLTVEAESPAGTQVYFSNVKAIDSVKGTVPVSYSPSSGSIFPIGDTTIGVSATDGLNTATTSFVLTVKDSKAPIISLTPANGDTVSVGNPEIKAVFTDVATGVDISSISMILDDQDVTLFATKDNKGITYQSAGLSESIHGVTVTVKDIAGNISTVTNTFQVVKSSKSVTISSDKASLPADGISLANISVSVASDGSPVEGATVKFTDTIGILSALSAVTDEQGRVMVTVKSNITGTDVITATYGAGSDAKIANVSINFTEFIKDTAAPTVSSYTPLDGTTDVATTVNPIITFSELIDKDTLTNLTIGLRYFEDSALVTSVLTVTAENGKTVVKIDPNYDLTNSAKYYLFVSESIKDLAGNAFAGGWTGNNKASHEFTIAAVYTPATSATINLKTGWNLISLPLVPTNSAIANVLGTLNSSEYIETIQYYDAATGSWSSYKPGYGGSLSFMEDGKGYWIQTKKNCALTFQGTESPKAPATPSIYGVVGNRWNLVGFTSITPKKVQDYITNMQSGDEILAVNEQGFYTTLSKDAVLNPGSGYWLYANTQGYNIIPK